MLSKSWVSYSIMKESITNVYERKCKERKWRCVGMGDSLCRVSNENMSVAVGGNRNADAVAYSSACENFVICLNTFNYACAICWQFSRVLSGRFERVVKGTVGGMWCITLETRNRRSHWKGPFHFERDWNRIKTEERSVKCPFSLQYLIIDIQARDEENLHARYCV